MKRCFLRIFYICMSKQINFKKNEKNNNFRIVRNAIFLRFTNDLWIMRIEDQRTMAFDQLFVRQLGNLFDPVGVIQQHAQIADAANARVEAGRRLSRFQTRETEDTFFRLAGEPIEVSLLVGTCCHTGSPGTTTLLIDQHNAIFAPFIKGT